MNITLMMWTPTRESGSISWEPSTTTVKLGDFEVLKLPNLLIFMREQAPTGGTIGTLANHIGLQVKN